jgi:hypothetical protein
LYDQINGLEKENKKDLGASLVSQVSGEALLCLNSLSFFQYTAEVEVQLTLNIAPLFAGA